MPLIQQYTPSCAGASQLLIAGSFIPNGSGTITTKYGLGFTVARASAGVYTVTLTQKFAQFVSVVVGCQFATSDVDSHEVRVGDISVANKTFQILHLTSTDVSATDLALADITASTTVRKIHFQCVVALSDVPGAGV